LDKDPNRYSVGRNSIDKINYISFLMYLIKDYLNREHYLIQSYENPRLSNVMYLTSPYHEDYQDAIKSLRPINR